MAAQDAQTLADIRQQLSILYVEIDALRAELTASGDLSTGFAGSTPLDRLNAIEAELQRLTSKTEELEFRINRITVDGTNRIGDLEYRLCEIEPGCDVSLLGGTRRRLVVWTARRRCPNRPRTPGQNRPWRWVSRQTLTGPRRRWMRATGGGRADQFAVFVQTYPGGPLSSQRSTIGASLSRRWARYRMRRGPISTPFRASRRGYGAGCAVPAGHDAGGPGAGAGCLRHAGRSAFAVPGGDGGGRGDSGADQSGMSLSDWLRVRATSPFQLRPARHIGLAVSGGSDSMAMLWLIAPWAREAGVALSVATVTPGCGRRLRRRRRLWRASAPGWACRTVCWNGGAGTGGATCRRGRGMRG